MERPNRYDEREALPPELAQSSTIDELEELESWDLDEMLDLVPTSYD